MSIQHPDVDVVAACRNPAGLLPTYQGEVRVGDLRDPDYQDRLLAGIDIICHAAGWSSFENSGDTCNSAYLEPTIDLINHAIEWRVSRFVNLSSIYVARPHERNNPQSVGHPRAYWPMINCMIAVEDYMRNYQDSRCQFINLRATIYSGQRLHTGLLPHLFRQAETAALTGINGHLGHLPLIDGQDIGQAFARAALAPVEAGYRCLNICGPETPKHEEVRAFSQKKLQHPLMSTAIPGYIAHYWLRTQARSRALLGRPALSTALLDMLESPQIDNTAAQQVLGYDPEVSWQASLLSTFDAYKNQKLNFSLSQPYRSLELD